MDDPDPPPSGENNNEMITEPTQITPTENPFPDPPFTYAQAAAGTRATVEGNEGERTSQDIYAQMNEISTRLRNKMKRTGPSSDQPDSLQTTRPAKTPRFSDENKVESAKDALTQFIKAMRAVAPTILQPALDPEEVSQARALILSISSPAETTSLSTNPSIAQDELTRRLGDALAPLVSKINEMEKSIAKVTNPPNITTSGGTPAGVHAQKSKEKTQAAHFTITKSSNPTPISPKRKSPPPPAPPKASLLSDPERRLVIVPPTLLRFPEGRIVTKSINDSLMQTQCKAKVLTVQPSMAGNPVIVVEEKHKAEDLLPFSNTIYAAIFGDRTDDEFMAYVDRPRFEVKINYCPTTSYDNQQLTADSVWASIQENDSRLRDIKPMCEPRWIRKERIESGARRGTILVALASEAGAQQVLKAEQSVAFGESVTFDRYEKRPIVKYCAWCASLNHTTTRCTKSKCQICTSEEHTTANHPDDTPEKCINCGGEHQAKYRNCAKRLQKLGSRQPRKPEVGTKPSMKPTKTLPQLNPKGKETPMIPAIKIAGKPKKKKVTEPEADWAAFTANHLDGEWDEQAMDTTLV